MLRKRRGYLLSRQISRNGLFAFGQAIFVTLSLFIVYRLVIMRAGLDQLGIWSLLLAGSAFARIGDVSGAGALSRFVAMRSYRGHGMWARDTVHTVLLTSFAFNTALSIILWFIAPFFLRKYVDPAYLTEATTLLPFAIANMFLGALAVAVTSGIDGTQRADQRALIMIVAALFFVLAGFALVPKLGVLGFAIAQVAYQCVILVIGWFVLRSHISGLGWIPRHWNRGVFVETTGYALKLNGIGVLMLLFEPLTKFAFNDIGGPSLVALYELASRLVTKVRDIAVAAALPLVPAFAAYRTTNDNSFRETILKVTRLTTIVAVVNTVIILAIAPVMSIVMLGQISHEFLLIVVLLSAGWNIGLPSLAFYLASQGQGILFWNFLSPAILASSVVLGVYTLVPLFGANGLLLAILFGLVARMFPLILGNARALGVMDEVRQSLRLIVISSVTISLLVMAFLLLI